MQDSEIVASVAAGDADGLAAAYDRYAAPLLAFCCSLLTERTDAADAVQDTFIVATGRLDGLRDPELLQPWLYAVARNECYRRLRAQAHAAGRDEVDSAPAVGDDTIDFGVNLDRAELREVVLAAMAGLKPSEREAIELSLRQEFTDEELARSLGINRNQAHALAGQARHQFESLLGTLLVARGGRPYCSKLDEMLESWDGSMTVLLRKRLSRHIRLCRDCSGYKRRELPAGLLLSVAPAVEIARGLRPQVLELTSASAAEAVSYRAGVVRRAAPFEEDGFPAPLDPPKVVSRAKRPVLTVAAAAAFAGLCAFGFEAGLLHHHAPPAAAAASLGNQAGTGQTGSSSGTTGSGSSAHRAKTSAHGSSASASPGATPSVTISVTPSNSSSSSSSPSSHPSSPSSTTTPPTPPTSPPPTTGTLSAEPASLSLGESAQGGDPTGSFTLTANGGSVSYSVSAPSGYAENLIISPASGTLAEGDSVTITVTWESSSTMLTSLDVGPSGLGVSVSYAAPSPDPSGDPTPTPTPTTTSTP